MPDQPGRHPGRGGDAADGGPFEAVLGELGHRRLADAGAGREVVEPRPPRPVVSHDSDYTLV